MDSANGLQVGSYPSLIRTFIAALSAGCLAAVIFKVADPWTYIGIHDSSRVVLLAMFMVIGVCATFIDGFRCRYTFTRAILVSVLGLVCFSFVPAFGVYIQEANIAEMFNYAANPDDVHAAPSSWAVLFFIGSMLIGIVPTLLGTGVSFVLLKTVFEKGP